MSLISLIQVRDIHKKGRGCVATTAIAAGSVVVAEHPLLQPQSTACVDERNRSTTCARCFFNHPYSSSSSSSSSSSLQALSRCAACRVTYYCSADCQRADWKDVHRLECSALAAIQARAAKTSPRTLPTIARAVMRVLIAIHSTSLADEERAAAAAASIEGLVAHRDDYPSETIEAFAQMAHIVASQLQLFDGEQGRGAALTSPKELIALFCKFGCNSIAVCQAELVNIGVGLYPLLAMVNHSCDPNCIVIFDSGAQACLRTIRPVKEGEELTISYIEIAETLQDRRSELATRYFFNCECELCTRQSRDESDKRTPIARCQEKPCKGIVLSSYSCTVCGPLSQSSVDSLRELLDSLPTSGTDDIPVKDLNHRIAKISRVLPDTSTHLLQVRRALLDALIASSDWRAAAEASVAVETSMAAIYPEGHPSIAVQAYVSAKLIMASQERPRGVSKLLGRALALVEKSHGRQHSLTKEIKDKLAECQMAGF